MIIAIDGPSGTGKSTVAKGVAQVLGISYFDTGAMYRSMAWWLSKSGTNLDDEEAVRKQLPSFRYEITGSGSDRKYFVDEIDVTDAIRSHEISTLASKIAIYPEVRKSLVQIQRAFGSKVDAVFEGRDMGTVVFPKAEVKVFLTANPEIRAARRYLELKTRNPNAHFSEDQILKDIEARDLKDMTRSASPLKQADDAILVDTSNLTADQVIEQVVILAKKKS